MHDHCIHHFIIRRFEPLLSSAGIKRTSVDPDSLQFLIQTASSCSSPLISPAPTDKLVRVRLPSPLHNIQYKPSTHLRIPSSTSSIHLVLLLPPQITSHKPRTQHIRLHPGLLILLPFLTHQHVQRGFRDAVRGPVGGVNWVCGVVSKGDRAKTAGYEDRSGSSRLLEEGPERCDDEGGAYNIDAEGLFHVCC
jgi:hypothetical protein